MMLPEMCEAYRMLQSGKRHARLDPEELLELKVNIVLNDEKKKSLEDKRKEINSTLQKVTMLRNEMDDTLIN